jgi:D-alanine-D-alanine ligase-like ATP-grasp enzyme
MSAKITNLQILKRAAKKYGYSFGLVDQPYSEAIYVTDGEKYFIARSKAKYGMYPTNPKFAEQLADDKTVTKRFLKKFGFRVIKGKIFYTNKINSGLTSILEKDTVKAAYVYAKTIGYPVFVKPNSGSRGANARIIFNQTGLKRHITHLTHEKIPSFLIEKFTVRPEYRIFVVDGKVQFMYRKQRITITGTGKHTIQELLAEQNYQPDKEYLSGLLKKEKKKISSVLATNQELTMQETANISLGAKITDYREKVPRKIDIWANSLYRTTGLGVFGVDIFTKGAWDDPKNYLIIEVNSNPALSGIYTKGNKDKAYKIWSIIMKRFFAS